MDSILYVRTVDEILLLRVTDYTGNIPKIIKQLKLLLKEPFSSKISSEEVLQILDDVLKGCNTPRSISEAKMQRKNLNRIVKELVSEDYSILGSAIADLATYIKGTRYV